MAGEKINFPAGPMSRENGEAQNSWRQTFSALAKKVRSGNSKLAAIAAVAPVAAPNAPAAAAIYTQADIQGLVTLTNELKTKLNALISASAS